MGNLGANATSAGSMGIADWGRLWGAKDTGVDDVKCASSATGRQRRGLWLRVMNMAALWKLPVTILREHGYTNYTRTAETRGVDHARAEAFGIEERTRSMARDVSGGERR